jgi:hypothetical protein
MNISAVQKIESGKTATILFGLLAWNVGQTMKLFTNGTKGETMKFRIVYALNGTRGIDITLPKGTELPSDWSSMNYEQRDEWLYENQDTMETAYEEIDYAEAIAVVQL